MPTTNEEYHLGELALALDPSDSRRITPPPRPASATVLDIGCGAGQTLIAAYPDRVSYGLDIDVGALALGGRLTKRVRFSRGRAEDLPYSDAQFDLVISRVALPYTNFQRSLKEIRRVLKPGGGLWITLHSFSMVVRNLNLRRPRTYVSFAYVAANSLLFHCFQRQFSLLGKCESFQTMRGVRRVLEENGFGGIEISHGRHFVVEGRVPGVVPPREDTAGLGASDGPAVFVGRGSEA
ncbi:MAG: class I SAM-dependent methyltransferase [Bryobacterales bacterium]